jgi:CBS domain-containing protein
MSIHDQAGTTVLPVGAAEKDDAGVVSCPLVERRVPTTTCSSCEYGWSVTLEGDSKPSFVLCRAAHLLSFRAEVDRGPAVSSIMSRKVIAVTPDLPIERLILLLVDENISGTPVVDSLGRPLGMVSKSDLVADDYDWAELRQEALPWQRIAGSHVANDEELFAERLLASQTVADIMTSVALTVREHVSISRAAAMMVSNHIHRLPVVDDQGCVIGIVTTFDIARWVAQQLGSLGPSPDAPSSR